MPTPADFALTVNFILQIATVTLLAFTTLLFFRSLNQGMHLWAGIGFSMSVLCYLVLDTPVVQETILRPIIMTGSICVPVFFLLLSKSIFEDDFRFKPIYGTWILLQTIPHIHHYLNCQGDMDAVVVVILNVVTEVISLGFVFAGIFVALRTRKEDLIEARLRFRNIFIIITAVLIGITLIVEATHFVFENKEWLQMIQRACILSLSGYFLLSNFGFRAGFFFREMPRIKQPVSFDTAMEDRLRKLFEGEKVYKTEGLTIKALAELMQVQEHKLRRLINVQLGFKNFNDFLNQYRVEEACIILSDPDQQQKTILEIAYALGYQSIGPFNKAFREQKGVTPTGYRKGERS